MSKQDISKDHWKNVSYLISLLILNFFFILIREIFTKNNTKFLYSGYFLFDIQILRFMVMLFSISPMPVRFKKNEPELGCV